MRKTYLFIVAVYVLCMGIALSMGSCTSELEPEIEFAMLQDENNLIEEKIEHYVQSYNSTEDEEAKKISLTVINNCMKRLKNNTMRMKALSESTSL